MALNLKKLKEQSEELNNRGGDGDYFKQSEITEETDIRILPPTESMEESYFFEEIGYWINGKRYVSPKTFGDSCPIEEEVKAAKELGDEDILALLKDNQKYKRSSVFLVPILLMECKFDTKGNCKSYKVVDNKPKVLQCGITLIRAINKIVTGRQFQNDTEDGICDRQEGFCITLSKTGKKLDTDYSAMGWKNPLEIVEEELYEKVPDVVEMTKKKLKTDEELRSIIRNFLYGEELKTEKVKPKSAGKRTFVENDDEEDDKMVVRKMKFKAEEDSEEVVEKPKKTATTAKSKKSLLSRLDEVEED